MNEIYNMWELLAYTGGVVVVGTGLVQLCGRFTFPHDVPDHKVEKVVNDILNPITTLGQMYRLYFNPQEQTFQTAEGKNVTTRIVGTDSKRITHLNLELLPLSRLEKMVASSLGSVAAHLPSATARGHSETEPYDALEEIKLKGERELRVEAFSFQDSQMIHGDYVFNVLYHKTTD